MSFYLVWVELSTTKRLVGKDPPIEQGKIQLKARHCDYTKKSTLFLVDDPNFCFGIDGKGHGEQTWTGKRGREGEVAHTPSLFSFVTPFVLYPRPLDFPV
jgi:hypothetical protein